MQTHSLCFQQEPKGVPRSLKLSLSLKVSELPSDEATRLIQDATAQAERIKDEARVAARDEARTVRIHMQHPQSKTEVSESEVSEVASSEEEEEESEAVSSSHSSSSSSSDASSSLGTNVCVLEILRQSGVDLHAVGVDTKDVRVQHHLQAMTQLNQKALRVKFKLCRLPGPGTRG